MLTIQFYPDGDAGPVQEYLDGMRQQGDRRKACARLIADLDILAQEGLRSAGVSIRSLGDGLWELRRMYQGVFYRVLFCIRGQEAWLLHVFEKETKKTPIRDLELARSRMAQVMGRR